MIYSGANASDVRDLSHCSHVAIRISHYKSTILPQLQEKEKKDTQ